MALLIERHGNIFFREDTLRINLIINMLKWVNTHTNSRTQQGLSYIHRHISCEAYYSNLFYFLVAINIAFFSQIDLITSKDAYTTHIHIVNWKTTEILLKEKKIINVNFGFVFFLPSPNVSFDKNFHPSDFKSIMIIYVVFVRNDR